MSDFDQLLASLPYDQLAAELGADPREVALAAEAALPALLGGLNANAAHPGGAASLMEALGQHDNDLADGPADLQRIDVADGEKISGHIFGDQQEDVIRSLGGVNGVSSGLVRKLLPILAPIVLSYLAKQVRGKNSEATGGGGILSSILEQVLSGATQGSGSRSSVSAGSILSDILGGLLGGGRR
ncbi:MAG: DUF937 domain-containing protein [Nocardioides sp.]